jgi:hypothetical protein
MSEISEIIIPAGVVLLGAWAMKKYFDTWQPETWAPKDRTCIGPICWSTYGPSTSSPYLYGGVYPGTTTPSGEQPQNPLDILCSFPGSEFILPPCSYKIQGWGK